MATSRPEPLNLRRETAGKGHRILANLVGRGQQDVVEAQLVGQTDDVPAMFEAASQLRVGNTEEFVVVAAERREPGNLCTAILRPN